MSPESQNPFDGMEEEALQASSAFEELQGKLRGLLETISDADGETSSLARKFLDLLDSSERLADGSIDLKDILSMASSAMDELSGTGSSVISMLEQVGAAVKSSGLSELAKNADLVAGAFNSQKESMDQNGSSLGSLAVGVLGFVSLAAALYDTLRVVDEMLGGQNLKWDHLGGAIGAVGSQCSKSGGLIAGLGTVVSGTVKRIYEMVTASSAATAGMTGMQAAGLLFKKGMVGAFSALHQLTSGIATLINRMLASKAAMAISGGAGTALGKVFKGLVLSGFGLTHAMSGLLGVLKSVPRVIGLCTRAMIKFIIASWPVLVPLMAIAAAILAVIAAWKAFKAMMNAGATIIKYLAKGLWAVTKAAWAVAKAVATGMYQAFKWLIGVIKDVVGWMYNLYQSIKGSILGALDRMAAALYAIIPALDKLSDLSAKAAKDTEEFFQRMRKDAQGATLSMIRLRNTFGESSGEMEKWARSYASSMGRSFSGTSDQLVDFYLKLKKLKLASADAKVLSKNLIQLGYDRASFLKVDPSGPIGALRAVLDGNSSALAKYGAAIEDAAVKNKLLENGINPDSATDAQKALAVLSIATKQMGDSWNHLRDNVEGYDNQQRMLNAELEETRVLIGNMLTRSTSSYTKMLIGAVRVVRQWIAQNSELVKKLINLPDILNAASVAFKVMAIGASVLAGGLLAVGSALSILFSPIGMITKEFIKQTGVLVQLEQFYHNAFSGAIEDIVQTVMAAKLAGISIGNWFKIGFATAKMAAIKAVKVIIEKVNSLVQALPSAIGSFGAFEVLGDTIGNHITRAFLTAKVGVLDFVADAATAINKVTAVIFVLYTHVRSLTAVVSVLAKQFIAMMALQLGKFDTAFELTKENLLGTAITESEKDIERMRKLLVKPFDTSAIRETVRKTREEIAKLDSVKPGEDGFTKSAEAAAKVAAQNAGGVLENAATALGVEAGKLEQQIKAYKDPANNDTGGLELIDKIREMAEEIRNAAKNSPLVEDFKEMSSDLLGQLNGGAAKFTAQGSFNGQLQGESVNIAKQSLGYQKDMVKEQRETRKTLATGAVVRIAGGN